MKFLSCDTLRSKIMGCGLSLLMDGRKYGFGLQETRRISLICILLLVQIGSISAEEVLFNGNFELGTAGFGVWRLLRQDTNPKLCYTPLKSGDGAKQGYFLQLDNPYGEYWQLRTSEFDLPADTNIRLTAMFQGPPGATVCFSVIHVTAENQWQVHAHRTHVNGAQQRVEYKFRTRATGAYMLIVYLDDKETPKGIFRIDSLSVDDSSRVQPPPQLTAAIEPGKRLYTLGSESSARIRTKLRNGYNSAVRGILELRLVDQTFGTEVWRKSCPLTLPPGVLDFDTEIPLSAYGTFKLKASWNDKDLRAFDGVFSVIGCYEEDKSFDPIRSFCVSINGGLEFEPFHSGSVGGFAAAGMSVRDKYRLFQQMGCRLLRDSPLDWKMLEPEEGKFDFRFMDFSIDLAREHGMVMMALFGRMYENYGPWQFPFRPDWLQKQLISIPRNPPGTNPKFQVKVPPMPVWERYVQAFAKHGGDRLFIYEIMNEPNLNMSPELYVKYMIPAARTIKQENPDAVVLGICATGDMNGQLLAFLKQCVTLGALDFLDGVSFHPYNARTLGSAPPADWQIDEIKATVGNKPIFNSELYYLYDYDNHYDAAGQFQIKPHHVAQRFLTDMGEGLRMSCSINERQLWQEQPLHPRLQYSTSYQTEYIPSGVFVACNALARTFEGAKALRKFKYDNGLVVYAYLRRGKPIAALWRYRGEGNCSIDLKGFSVYDLFGNLLENNELPLTPNPYYLSAEGMTTTAFLERLSQLAPVFTQPVEISSDPRLVDGNLYFTLMNRSAAAQKISLGLTGGQLIARKMLTLTLAPRENRNTSLQVSPGDSSKPALFLLHTGSQLFRLPFTAMNTVCLTEGEEFSSVSRDGKLSFAGRINFDQDRVRLRLLVKDVSPSGPTGERQPWETDGVELFFDVIPDFLPQVNAKTYTQDTFRIFLTPHDKKLLTVWGDRVKAKECRAQSQTSPEGYELDLDFPLTVGSLLGFGVKVNDATDCNAAVRSAGWGIAPDSHKNRLSLGIIKKGTSHEK